MDQEERKDDVCKQLPIQKLAMYIYIRTVFAVSDLFFEKYTDN